MLLQLLVALVCIVAGLMQMAAIRSPDTSDLTILKSARRITGVTLIAAGVYVGYAALQLDGAHPVFCWLLGAFGLGQILFALHTFYEPSETAHLMRPTPQGGASAFTAHR